MTGWIMRAWMLSAAAALIACSAPVQAAAQGSDGSLAGTWAFQTESYGNMQTGAIMSGTAILTPAGAHRYDVRLLAHERIVDRMTGRTRLITAHQTCTCSVEGGQITISCEMAEPLEGYQPDTFVLQQREADELVGALDSSAHSQVTFSRVR